MAHIYLPYINGIYIYIYIYVYICAHIQSLYTIRNHVLISESFAIFVIEINKTQYYYDH